MQTKTLTHTPNRLPELLTSYLKEQVKVSPALARQFLATLDELKTTQHDQIDPIGDLSHSPVLGIVHRYQGRVLLLPTMSCAATCRFCFRRDRLHKPDNILSQEELETAFQYINQDSSIEEVILSGGDPLTIPDAKLSYILQRLDQIPHVTTLRIHTRLPIVDPDRATIVIKTMQQIELNKPCWMVLHINHPDELSTSVCLTIKELQKSGFILLSQSVLLSGVNDDETILAQLFTRLVALGVKPYYLHQLDLAVGTDHFRVPLSKGRTIMEALRGKISGLALPTYILDTPGGHGKVWAMDALVTQRENSSGWQVKMPDGTVHDYPADADFAG